MLELRNVSYALESSDDGEGLLRDVSFRVPGGHLMAVAGPSGCGKTTLLKVLAGILIESSGEVHWKGANLAGEGSLSPSELGYVPQFSIAYDFLTVEESVAAAVKLRVRASGSRRGAIVERVLDHTGLLAQRDQRVGTLSGGQKRRLSLAMELVSDPVLLLCDEVTSGLDPQAEVEITRLLHGLARESGRLVINVTHSMSHIGLYDSVLMLSGGRLAYHGPPNKLAHWFSAEAPEDIYANLAGNPPDQWHASWGKHHGAYYRKLKLPAMPWLAAPQPPKAISSEAKLVKPGETAGRALSDGDAAETGSKEIKISAEPIKQAEPGAAGVVPFTKGTAEAEKSAETSAKPAAAVESAFNSAPDSSLHEPAALPGAVSQFFTLLERRTLLFVRDRVHLWLQIALLLGFPLLVVIFVSAGVGQMPKRLDFSEIRTSADYLRQTGLIEQQVKIGGLISSVVLMQVILLALMGTNNSAREIASERLIFEKEKLAGLRPSAYLGSKMVFLGLLVVAQSVWMGVFVNAFAHLPGEFGPQLFLLVLINAALTALCLGISSVVRSAEQGSLLGIYLAGFQLPLSGVLLSLPATLEPIIRPFISAYWSWAGQVQTMRDSDFFVGVRAAVPTELVNDWTSAALVLAAQVAVGLWVAWVGCRRNLWQS